MVPLSDVKYFQPSWRGLTRPMLLISLALHGLILFTPTPSNPPEAKPKEPEEEAVSLTQLPPVNRPAATPSPTTSPRPVPAPRRLPTSIVRRNIPPTARRNAPPPVQVNRSPQPANPISPPPSSAANAFSSGFPVYPGSRTGAIGLPAEFNAASRNTDDAVSAVMSFFERELPAKGYTPTLVDEGTGRTVYQISKQGTTQYLHLIPNPTGAGTNIILSAQLLPNDLGSIQVEDIGVATFFSDLPVPSVDPNTNIWQRVSEPQRLLSQPTAFFADLGSEDGGFVTEPALRSEIRTAVVGVNQAPQAVFQDISQRLEIASYAVRPMGTYGGGELYEMSRDETNNQGQMAKVTGYLSVVPSANEQSTVIFVWERRPPQ